MRSASNPADVFPPTSGRFPHASPLRMRENLSERGLFLTELSAGALAVKANHKGTLESRAPRMRAHPYDSWFLGLS